MQYEILIEQSRARVEVIEADSLQEAKEKAYDGVVRGEYDMDDSETVVETTTTESRM